jgi:hypothetical protein
VLTLAAYVSYVRHLGNKGSPARYLAVAFLFAMGLMSKPPSLVTLPFVLLLLDYWPLNRFGQPVSADTPAEPIRWQDSFSVFKGLVIEKIPLFALSTVSCVVTILTMTRTLIPLEQRSIAARLGNAIVSYTAYLLCPTLFIVDARFSENTRRLYPIAWCVAGSALFENEKARNEHRVWLGASSAETIEKFLAEYYCF